MKDPNTNKRKDGQAEVSDLLDDVDVIGLGEILVDGAWSVAEAAGEIAVDAVGGVLDGIS